MSPDGRNNANGTESDPLNIVHALNEFRGQPGDQLILRGGEYALPDTYTYTSALAGGEAAQVTVTNYPGEEVIFRFGISQQGSYARWISVDYGMHRQGDDAVRVTEGATYDKVSNGFVLDDYNNTGLASGCDLINFRITDNAGSGIFWFGAQTGLLYGNFICNNGWVDASREHGPGHYMYNQSYDHTKTIKNTVVLNSFRPASQIGDGGGTYPAYNFVFEDFTTNQRFFAGTTPADNLIVRRLFASSEYEVLQLGLYTTQDSGSALFEDCVIDAPLQFRAERFAALTFRRCKFTAATYALTEPVGGTTLVLEDCEVVSTGNFINFVPNEYAPGFATLSVIDLDDSGAVVVDVSALAVSGTVRVRNPMLWAEYQDLTVTDGEITLPLTGWTTPPPLGFDTLVMGSVFSTRFGAWVVQVLA